MYFYSTSTCSTASTPYVPRSIFLTPFHSLFGTLVRPLFLTVFRPLFLTLFRPLFLTLIYIIYYRNSPTISHTICLHYICCKYIECFVRRCIYSCNWGWRFGPNWDDREVVLGIAARRRRGESGVSDYGTFEMCMYVCVS